MVTIEQKVYGMTESGEAIIVYTMTSDNGSSVELCNFGATILAVNVPDRDGKIADVALGYKNYDEMTRDNAAVGRTIGRVANRIGAGRMTIEGVEYKLPINNGPNHLHGGGTVAGLGERIWESRVETNRIVMSLHSPDGDNGYPGAVDLEAIFDFDDEYSFELTYRAVSDKTTVLNMMNHVYFNLSGEFGTTIRDHELKVNATKVLEMNDVQLPTGKELEIAGTTMDFTNFKCLGDAIDGDFNNTRLFRGIDHYYVAEGWQKSILDERCVLRDPKSGRQLTVYSSSPGVAVYAGNWLSCGCPISKSGAPLIDNEGVALETQVHPNAINEPSFPSIEYKAGEEFCQKTVFKFSTY